MTGPAQPQPVILRTRGVGRMFGKFVALKDISAEILARSDHFDYRS